MKFYLITALVFLAAWLAAYFAFIRPLLLRYSITADVLARLQAAEGDVWKKIGIWLEAKKTLLVLFLTSAFAAGKGATTTAVATTKTAVVTTVTGVTSLAPTDLVTLQDKSLWSAFFSDVVSLHIIAAISLLAAFLSLKGKVAAARIVPAAAAK